MKLRMVKPLSACIWDYAVMEKNSRHYWILISYDTPGIKGMKSDTTFATRNVAYYDLNKFRKTNGLKKGTNLQVGSVKEIPLENSDKKCLVDREDYIRVRKWRWYLTNCGKYVHASKSVGTMHRFIMNLSRGDGKVIDHRNRNGLDNRKRNLRILKNIALNNWNRGAQKNSASRYKGVRKRPEKKLYCAEISIGGKKKHIGYFRSPEMAAEAYNRVAKKMVGEYAFLNKVPLLSMEEMDQIRIQVADKILMTLENKIENKRKKIVRGR